MDFLTELEEMILHRFKSSQPSGATEATGGGMGDPGMGGGMEPVPVAPVEPLSRGPAPSPNQAGAIADLERMMAGS